MNLKALLALLCVSLSLGATAAEAQFVQQPITYPSNSFPVIGNGSTPAGGLPPVWPSQPADVATVGGPAEVANHVTTAGILLDNPVTEAKFRTVCVPSHELPDDPIINPGDPGGSHDHTFFGNPGANAFSTYQTLRANTQQGTCAGSILNNSAYWHPSVKHPDPHGDGKARTKKPVRYIVYYLEGKLEEVELISPIPRGLAYVSGFNMADPNDDRFKTPIADAMAVVGRDKTWLYQNNGFVGWECSGAPGYGINANSPNQTGAFQPYLKDAQGNLTLDCPTEYTLVANWNGAECWDGVNLTAPDGRSHVGPKIKENNSASFHCPDGWYRLPSIVIRAVFDHNGPSEWGEWYFASDKDHMGNWLFLPGESGHVDWFGAWDYGTAASPGIMIDWMTQCIGLTFPGVTSTIRGCDYSTFNATERMLVEQYVDLNVVWKDKGSEQYYAPVFRPEGATHSHHPNTSSRRRTRK